jgi:hypothetical protein
MRPFDPLELVAGMTPRLFWATAHIHARAGITSVRVQFR